ELRAAAEAAAPSGRLDGLVRGRIRARRARRRRRAALGAAAAVVAVAMIAAVAGRGPRPDGPQAPVARPPPPPPARGPLPPPPRLAGGLRPVRASGGARPGVPLVGRRGPLRRLGPPLYRVLSLSWRVPGAGDPLAPFRRGGRRTTVRGAPAVQSTAGG